MNTPSLRSRALLQFGFRCTLSLSLVLPAMAQEQRPPIFQDIDYEDAQEAAKATGGLVILDAMTSWCGPCKQMDRTTWIDPRLVEWIDANAVAIQMDMDLNEELKQQLEIRAFPTILLFKGGEEFDRIVGLRSAEEMLAWLGAGLEGKRAKDTVLERLAELRAIEDSSSTWGERAKLVEDLKWFGEHAEAAREHVWLWRNLPDTTGGEARHRRYRWGAQRFSMRDIASQDPAASATFKVLRDELTAAVLAGQANQNSTRDWIELNFVVADEAATVRWANALAQSADGVVQLRGLENRLFSLLIAQGAWRTAGLTLNDPIARTKQQRDDLGAYDNLKPEGSKGGSVPMIPMGGMQPAKSAPQPASATQEASAPKTIPAIPLNGGKQKRTVAVPMIPMGAGAAKTPDADPATQVRWLLTEEFRTQASQRYAALLAAERDGEARGVADIIIGELDDNRARAGLLAAAMRANAIGREREAHQAWLDQLAR